MSNIGHEAINQFKAANGERYVYIPPRGKIPSNRNVEYVVFVRNDGYANCLEVIAYAKLDKDKDSEKKFTEVTYSNGETELALSDLLISDNDDVSKLVVYKTKEYKIPRTGFRIF